jgi:nitrite reductase/ring-hydroxylating ferredoxin subunit
MKSTNIFTKIIFLITVLAIVPLLFFCKKDKQNLVPYVYVDFYVDIDEPYFADLHAVGNSVSVTGGVEGIIIFRKSLDEFVAIERCCSYNPEERCIVARDSVQTGTVICPCCKSVFSIYDGSIIKTPASHPLTLYQTSFDQLNNRVHVTN